MAIDSNMQYLVERLQGKISYLYGYLKETKVLVNTSDEITEEFITLLAKAIWTKATVHDKVWKDFISKFRERLYHELDVYLKYIIYACIAVKNDTRDIFKCFLYVCTVVFGICINFCRHAHIYFFKYTPIILNVIFSFLFRQQFYKLGGFKELLKHISIQKPVLLHHDIRKITDVSPDSVKSLMVTEEFDAYFPQTLESIQPRVVERHKQGSFLASKILKLKQENPESVWKSFVDAFPLLIQASPRVSGKFMLRNSLGYKVILTSVYLFETTYTIDPISSRKANEEAHNILLIKTSSQSSDTCKKDVMVQGHERKMIQRQVSEMGKGRGLLFSDMHLLKLTKYWQSVCIN
ncbi:hypothetical protein CEXT_199621 [Caerostris extrusa]|uniref:Uncharacterized protein n=1 Tax=Caerostris extrusa TaxID=172846 RepID=A0AAV4XJV6_CAEEX|nr:hypothetical protein CEXT_199621 [Caerostris extrusa]